MMSSTTCPWRPLLSGAEAEEALHVARAIGDALIALPPQPSNMASDLALFYAYLDAALPGSGYVDRAEARLDEAIATMADEASGALGFGLYDGPLGVAWVTEHLAARTFEFPSDPNEPLDAPLGALLESSPWQLHFDLISGLVGMGVYALERLDRAAGPAHLASILRRLRELAEPRSPGRTLLTTPETMVEPERRVHPRGYHNLGVAHGVPGVIGLLAACVERGVAGDEDVALLRDCVAWLLAQRIDAPQGRFAYYSIDGLAHGGSRTAWCYGDPGVAAVLLRAARVLREPAWEEAALALALDALSRPRELDGVVDVTLCHGTAGLGHLFNRLHQATGEAAFAAAARARFADGLLMRRADDSIAGFSAWGTGVGRWMAEPGFLCGAAGVGLAYLAAATDIEPAWDRLLLASIPPSTERRTS
jgi:hypothetical protein